MKVRLLLLPLILDLTAIMGQVVYRGEIIVVIIIIIKYYVSLLHLFGLYSAYPRFMDILIGSSIVPCRRNHCLCTNNYTQFNKRVLADIWAFFRRHLY